jgi:hypothetical protein
MNELPCEDYAVPKTLKTLKELLFAEDDQYLVDFLSHQSEDAEIYFNYFANGDLKYIEIELKQE